MCLFFKRLLVFLLFCGVSVAAEPYRFKPEGCEFSAMLFKEPELKYSWRGEHLITVAEVQPRPGTVMRASCGAYFIEDQKAFRDNLHKQMTRAARLAGVKQHNISIKHTDMGTVASFWGYRGKGRLQTWYRSDTYVGRNSFLELVVHTVPENRESLNLAAFQQSVKR